MAYSPQCERLKKKKILLKADIVNKLIFSCREMPSAFIHMAGNLFFFIQYFFYLLWIWRLCGLPNWIGNALLHFVCGACSEEFNTTITRTDANKSNHIYLNCMMKISHTESMRKGCGYWYILSFDIKTDCCSEKAVFVFISLLSLCPLGMPTVKHQHKASMWKQQSECSFNTCCKCENPPNKN